MTEESKKKHKKETWFMFGIALIQVIIALIAFKPDHHLNLIGGGNLDEKTTNEIAQKKLQKNPPNINYIFVLDISTSYNPIFNDKQSKYSQPRWYKDERKKINRFIKDSCNDFGHPRDQTHPSIFKVCKLKLCLLLKLFRTAEGNYKIWTLGDEVNQIKWGKFGLGEIKRETLKNTMKEIVQFPPNNSPNTNFITLFNDVLSELDELGKKSDSTYNEGEFPIMVITIISDMVHDEILLNERRQLGNSELDRIINNSKGELKEAIDVLSKKNVKINICWLKKTGNLENHEIDVLALLNGSNAFPSTRLKIHSIDDKNEEKIVNFFPDRTVEEPIVFSFPQGAVNPKCTFNLRLDAPGDYYLGLKRDPEEKRKISYQVLLQMKGEKSGVEYYGKLSADGELTKLPDLNSSQRIGLSFKENIPQSRRLPDFKIVIPGNDKKCYCIPIHFREALPWWKMYLLYVLWVIPIYLMVLVFDSVIYFLFRKRLKHIWRRIVNNNEVKG